MKIKRNKDSNNYTEVRHIILKGTNEQIGKALDYSVIPSRYADPIYAKARLIYMQKSYSAFYERMKGAAEAYNVSLGGDRPFVGARASGLSDLLAARMILDTCKSVEEAKLVLLNNRI